MTSFVGVDLHRNNFTYCIRENGEEKKIGKCEISDLKGFASLLGKNTVMAVEATGNTFMFCRFLKAHVGRLVVVNPSQFKVISMSTKKTDRHDAKVLAEFLEKDMLPFKSDADQGKAGSVAYRLEKQGQQSAGRQFHCFETGGVVHGDRASEGVEFSFRSDY